jgi:hypothetical protein
MSDHKDAQDGHGGFVEGLEQSGFKGEFSVNPPLGGKAKRRLPPEAKRAEPAQQRPASPARRRIRGRRLPPGLAKPL